MTTEPKAECVEAVATYGMRRKGATEIIGIVPPKVHAFPARRKEYLAEFEEVPLYTHPITPAVEALVETQKAVIHWAQSKCPCKEETPDPCTLCGASVADGTCMAVESIFPRELLASLRAALAHPEIAAALLKGEKA